MTSEEAKEALKAGKKVRCLAWDDKEIRLSYLSFHDKEFEDILDYLINLNKDDDWEIVE